MDINATMAKLDNQYIRGLIGDAEYRTEMRHVMEMHLIRRTARYTFISLVDGTTAGLHASATFEEVSDLLACGICPDEGPCERLECEREGMLTTLANTGKAFSLEPELIDGARYSTVIYRNVTE